MQITIYGTGYVGLVSGASLASLGHDVLCIDIDSNKIENLKRGVIPIFEPDLATLVKDNVAAGRLRFAMDTQKGVEHGLLQFICVGTPTRADGHADISSVIDVAKTIAEHMDEFRIIINKSTVPIGTAAKVKATIQSVLEDRASDIRFSIASNPEFLKEGHAVFDFLHPDRIVIGVEDSDTENLLRELYEPLTKQGYPICAMDIASAELTKYAANAILATKISFINEIANLAEKVGANIDDVRKGIAADPRIGPHFIAPGCGYGGSCFPKDVKALIHIAADHALPAHILRAVETVNEQQKKILFHKLHTYFKGQLRDKTIAIWGLAFKPNTDDVREASSRVLIDALLPQAVTIQAYDPVAMPAIEKIYAGKEGLKLMSDAESCLEKADALVVCTEWDEFKRADLHMIARKLKTKVLFDGRNIFDKIAAHEAGLEYCGIGRG